MNNVKIIELTDNLSGEKYEWVVINKNDNESIGMLKSTYDAQQVAQATLASELSNPSTPQAGE